MRNPELIRKTNRELANELLAARAIVAAVMDKAERPDTARAIVAIMDEAAGRLRRMPQTADMFAQTRAAINAALDEEVSKWL